MQFLQRTKTNSGKRENYSPSRKQNSYNIINNQDNGNVVRRGSVPLSSNLNNSFDTGKKNIDDKSEMVINTLANKKLLPLSKGGNVGNVPLESPNYKNKYTFNYSPTITKQISSKPMTSWSGKKNVVSEDKSPSEIYIPSAKSVVEYAYRESQNQRESMEDFYKISDKYMGDRSKGLFCLFDGHGGSETAKYAIKRLPELFSKLLTETNHNVDKSMVSAFTKVDEELKHQTFSQSVGSTACVVYFHKENDIICGSKTILTCANIGDTRAILVTSNEVKRLSYDHKCTDETEVSRIRKSGGVVFNGRMFGQLALSRAFGDHSMKKCGLIATPFVNKHTITDRDRFLIMCSDGVWDVLDDGQVFEISMDHTNSNDLAEEIVKKAIENGSGDNISCIVIKLN